MLTAIVEALRSAGATEEIIAVAVKAGGDFAIPHRAKEAARKRRARAAKRPPDAAVAEPSRPPDTPPAETERPPDDVTLRRWLLQAAQGNVDTWADISPIRALLDQGCDLEADVVPIVARELPELPRPLKNWGAPWLVRDILAARDQRLAGAGFSTPTPDRSLESGNTVEAPPPVQRTPAIEWDEFVGGYRAGLIQWNRARLGPCPGEPGCRAPAEVLRENGYGPAGSVPYSAAT
jgi:hypothetical protein